MPRALHFLPLGVCCCWCFVVGVFVLLFLYFLFLLLLLFVPCLSEATTGICLFRCLIEGLALQG